MSTPATTVTVRGIPSTGLQAGSPHSDEAVFFVHGNPGSSDDWKALVAEVGGFARAVAFDMPGFGRAGKPDDFDYTIDGYADHIDAMLDELGIRRVHLVLHDFGGGWGLGWAVKHPDQLASVTLINTGILPDYRWHHAARIWRTPVLGELFQASATRTMFRLMMKIGNPRGLPPEFVETMYDNYDAATRRAVLRLYRDTHDFNGPSRQAIDALHPLRKPALVVWGQADPYIPKRYAEIQRQAFPDAEVHTMQDSGHWPMADNPEVLGSFVIPFLRRQIGAG